MKRMNKRHHVVSECSQFGPYNPHGFKIFLGPAGFADRAYFAKDVSNVILILSLISAITKITQGSLET